MMGSKLVWSGFLFGLLIIVVIPVIVYLKYPNGAGTLAAEIMLVLVLWIEGLIAWQQLQQDRKGATEARSLQLELEVNRQIQEFRNDEKIRKIRWKIEEIAIAKDATEVAKAKLLDNLWNSKEDGPLLRQFLARMNNLCWVIQQCPTTAVKPVTEIISENVVREWNWLLPLVQERRKERGEDVNAGWYMHNFQQVAEALSSRKRNSGMG